MDKLTLKAVRVSQGLTLREVANKVDRNFQTISKYEKDSTKIPADLLMKLLNLYDTPIESIFLGKSTKKSVLWTQEKRLTVAKLSSLFQWWTKTQHKAGKPCYRF